MFGLIGAMALEMEKLIRDMQDKAEMHIGEDVFYQGNLYRKPVVVCICGPGKVNAALATQSMILNFHPEWILNLGVAGSCEDNVALGDVVIATGSVQHDVDTSAVGDPVGLVSRINRIVFPVDPGLQEKLVQAAHTLEGVHAIEGIIATGDQFVNDASTRARVHHLFAAKAIEMEGAAVAHACLMHHVPCGILRSISDHADGQSPMDYAAFSHLAAHHAQQIVQTLLEEYT